MAILNLMELQPTTISRDLQNKYILLYGLPKVGKTTFAAQCPNNLILCFEKGVNFLPNIYAVDVAKWADFKALLKQLDKPDVKQKFHTITIDTLSIAWDLCEKFICSNNGVKALGDIPWGKGYALLKDEFSDALRQISMMGYGIILIAHAKVKEEKINDNEVIEKVSPNIPERAQDIVNALVDVIGYIDIKWTNDENGYHSDRTLITRGSPNIVAGSRLKYLKDRIPFGYPELVAALGDAIDKQQSLDGAAVTEKTVVQNVIKTRPFADTVSEAKTLWERIVTNNAENAEKIMDMTAKIFGEPTRLSEIPESKQDLFELLIEDMRSLASSL